LNKLKLAAALSLVYMLAEAAGGWYTNSLALVADAGHMFTDVVAMSLTLVAAWFAERPATAKKNLRLLSTRDPCCIWEWQSSDPAVDLGRIRSTATPAWTGGGPGQ